MKSPTKRRKSPETPIAAPKRAKKKDTEGQATLTSKPLTMKNQRKRGRRVQILKTHKTNNSKTNKEKEKEKDQKFTDRL